MRRADRDLLPPSSSASSSDPASSDLRPAFDVLDADRDGRISRDDLKSFYTGKFGSSDSLASADDKDNVIGSMISAADSDQNGFVEFEEFKTAVGRRAGPGSGIMEEVFRVMDRDGDGLVGFEDLKAYLEWAGMGLGDDEVRAMIKMVGGDDAQGIGFEGLIKILTVDLGN